MVFNHYGTVVCQLMHGLLVHKDKPQLTELSMFWKDAGFCVSAQFLHNEILKTENFPLICFFLKQSMVLRLKVT